MTASDTSVLEYRMIRAEFTVAAIVLGITVAVAVLDAIKECSPSSAKSNAATGRSLTT
jgi:multisubunit Na+/H+ antiporter MnhE subunit